VRVDEDDYLARSRRRKEQLQREAPVPYIHGPREDENPIIDYIIKTHKYTRAGRLAKPSTAAGAPLRGVARADHESLASVLVSTQAFNTLEDSRQLSAAHERLAAVTHGAHLAPPVLLTERLNQDYVKDRQAAGLPAAFGAKQPAGLAEEQEESAAVDVPGGAAAPSLYSRAGEGLVAPRADPPLRRRTVDRERLVSSWSHDKFGSASRSPSRSPSRSRSRSRDADRGRSRSGDRPARGEQASGRSERGRRSRSRSRSRRRRSRSPDYGEYRGSGRPPPPERPSPTYSPLR